MFHKNLHRYFLILLTPLILAARSREPQFDRDFKKNCEAIGNGNTSYCACAPGLVKRHCPEQARQTHSPKITERQSLPRCSPSIHPDKGSQARLNIREKTR